MQRNEKYMKIAINEAKKALTKNEAPIGAIIVLGEKVISRGHNLRESTQNSLGHAELEAIRKACKKLGTWRLIECEMFVTLEPCPMCAGAIIQSRIRSVCFGAYDPKAGAAGSVVDLFNVDKFNHKVQILGGILQQECSTLLTGFFAKLRKEKNEEKR